MKRRKTNPAKFDRCVKKVKRSLKTAGRQGNAFAICRSSQSNPPDFRLYRKAQAADDRFQRALEKAYGSKAGDMRYSYSQPPKIKKLADAKKKADAVWLASMRSNPARGNPFLDPTTFLLTPNVLGAIEEQREKIARSFGRKKRKNLFGKKKVTLHLKRSKSGKFTRRKNKGRANSVPDAEARYQSFHGRPSEQLVKVRTTLHTHDVLAGIGDLRKLKIKSANGRWKVTVKFLKPYPILSMNEAATQLYIEGGDQSVNLKDFGITTPHEKEVLGHVTDVYYFTTKDHLRPEDGGTAVYHHKFGKIKPTMVYDVRNQLMEFAGGGYTIPDEGIDQ